MSYHKPSLVIHGGAGHITRTSLPPNSPAYKAYITSLHRILASTSTLLSSPTATALEAACHAVVLLENDELFNAGKGTVFTRSGTNELEASIMITRGTEKRGVGVMCLRRVKNPVLLARELLVRGKGEGGCRHNVLCGEEAERLAGVWGCEIVEEGYFWTEKRWKEHLRGLKEEEEEEIEEGMEATPVATEDLETDDDDDELKEYLPQGTVGCVVRDRWGTICVATSTGGLTNKLPGRIGDTPTLGAGFWAEEWEDNDDDDEEEEKQYQSLTPSTAPTRNDALPITPGHRGSVWEMLFRPRYTPLQAIDDDTPTSDTPLLCGEDDDDQPPPVPKKTRAIGISGTGNGDYFLRLAAAHSVAGRCRFGKLSLHAALAMVVGKGGEMQRAAEDIGEWGRGGGDGGFIGIDEMGHVEMVMNCQGMFRGTVDAEGRSVVAVYCDEELSREG